MPGAGSVVVEPLPGVTVRWHAAGADADAALRAQVGTVVGVEPQQVTVGRLCGRCGSSGHGRPWASHGVHVSLSRSGDHVVTAVSTTGTVGVDVERVGGARHDRHATQAWCRTEAALKRDGTGFAVGPEPAPPGRGRVVDLEAPDGYCAALAVGSGGSAGV